MAYHVAASWRLGFLDHGEHSNARDYPINTFFWFFEARNRPTAEALLAIWLNAGAGRVQLRRPHERDRTATPWRGWGKLLRDPPDEFTSEVDFGKLLATNLTTGVGTFGSQRPDHTANTTARATHALWHFTQTWFAEFPHYRPVDDRISLWAESYGSHYGPGIHIFDQVLQDELWYNWTRPYGCKEQVSACAQHLRGQDPLPLNRGLLSLKNLGEICTNATEECAMAPWTAYRTFIPDERARGWYDIAHPKYDPFPPPYYLGYLRAVVAAGFEATHDFVRGRFLENVAYLLNAGVKVHLMRGEFASAGYAEMLLTEPDDAGKWRMGGLTKQLGNLNFTRVFQAGHEVPSYAPEAAYRIFNRVIFGRDIATGRISVDDRCKTRGPRDAWDRLNMPPDWPYPRCYIFEPLTYVPEVWEKVKKGAVVVKDWFVVDDNEKIAENGKGWDGMQGLKKHDQVAIGDL
ncbi:hypothetical protein DL766_007750 [Monosporascus sp. MC13-8B]|nr:hypothetical protein DL766_007750 [Monosporascus sp. MC13-8B]